MENKLNQVSFIVPGKITSKGRPRARVIKSGSKGGGSYASIYTPQDTIIYENLIKMCYKEQANLNNSSKNLLESGSASSFGNISATNLILDDYNLNRTHQVRLAECEQKDENKNFYNSSINKFFIYVSIKFQSIPFLFIGK